ncbi:hypothetical protein WR25_01615 isoform A [Diploscapter pachys]|uniref:Uncharacterized protein n=1 Tax=Diploscapter pachys TaxID=2018661 RepID=A0A2A2LX37_9BILA|nr:hypothetical protein WR25_01615 isoform A [Diploscapter pachys]
MAAVGQYLNFSWDSFGRESGIMTGDGEEDSDTGGATTPTPRRMRDLAPIGIAKPEAKYTKEQCEFPLLNMNVNGQSPILMPSAEKRRYSGSLAKGQPTPVGMKSGAQEDEQPIACRLRSNDDSQRNVKVAARRIPVRLLINHPPPEETPRTPQPVVRAAGPAPPKRTRRNSWRPSLDFEKMNQHRLDSTAEIPEHSDNDNNGASP